MRSGVVKCCQISLRNASNRAKFIIADVVHRPCRCSPPKKKSKIEIYSPQRSCRPFWVPTLQIRKVTPCPHGQRTVRKIFTPPRNLNLDNGPIMRGGAGTRTRLYAGPELRKNELAAHPSRRRLSNQLGFVKAKEFRQTTGRQSRLMTQDERD